ncbi:MAG: hypothetical protein ABIR49_00285 [Nitrosospira sp.]
MRILQEFVLSWMVDFIPDAIPRGSYELRAFNSFLVDQAFHLSLSFILPSGSYLSGN